MLNIAMKVLRYVKNVNITFLHKILTQLTVAFNKNEKVEFL